MISDLLSPNRDDGFRAVSIALKLQWTRQDLFGDLRVRYGIKVAVAGLLALFCVQDLRLQSANWAVLTVQVLMTQQFVGSFALLSYSSYPPYGTCSRREHGRARSFPFVSQTTTLSWCH